MATYHREAKYIIGHIDKAQSYISDEIDAHKRMTRNVRENHLEMKRKLLECLELIDTLIEQDNQTFDETATDEVDDIDDMVAYPAESSTKRDDTSNKPAEYDSKYILHNYATRLDKAVEADYTSTAVSSFVVIISDWIKMRFLPERKDPTFHYRPERISEWIDTLILSYGKALSEGKEIDFQIDFTSWLSHLRTTDDRWPIPYENRNVIDSTYSEDFTQEAVLIERLVKPKIYDGQFYPNKLSTVCETVIRHNTNIEIKDINKMIDNCTNKKCWR